MPIGIVADDLPLRRHELLHNGVGAPETEVVPRVRADELDGDGLAFVIRPALDVLHDVAELFEKWRRIEDYGGDEAEAPVAIVWRLRTLWWSDGGCRAQGGDPG